MVPDLERIVELACLAPSVHNTQPWLWRANGCTLDLLADRTRMLPVADPRGRNLAISCGAALHHAQVAAAALGWRPTVSRLPRAVGPAVLARIELDPTEAPPDAEEQLRALRTRCTDRRRFTAWPIPVGRLQALVSQARLWGAAAVAVTDPRDRVRVELLASRALMQQRSDRALMDEQHSWVNTWVNTLRSDGIPPLAVPAPEEQSGRADRFNVPALTRSECSLGASDGVIVLGGETDDAAAWLRTGEALSALWLTATLEGLAVVPLTQVIEVEETRCELRGAVLGGLTVPHLIARIGWQPIGRRELRRTPRRPVSEVLLAPFGQASQGVGPLPTPRREWGSSGTGRWALPEIQTPGERVSHP